MRAWMRAMAGLTVIACGDASAPSEVAKLRFVELTAGAAHTCGRTTVGTTYCWGDNLAGQIGARTDQNQNPIPLQVVVRPLQLNSVAGGRSFTCGLLNTRVPLCWGNQESSPRLVRESGPFVSFSAGDFVCGIRDDSRAICWDDPDAAPYSIEGPSFTQVSVGGHACAIASDASAWCWQNGSTMPQPVPGDLTFTAITTGDEHACGVTPDGMGYCWGRNFTGQLGNLSTLDTVSPDTVFGGYSWSQLSAGEGHTCGVTIAGRAYCWGEAGSGQLGYDGPPPSGRTYLAAPTQVRGGALPAGVLWSAVAAGGAHSCGVTTEGLAFCWGENGRGQLGDGSTDDSAGPVPIGPAE